jgi:hypothetical protein
MNIFYLSHNTTECAKLHVDKHVVKMVLEYAQLLSTAHRVIDGIQCTSISKNGRKQTIYTLADSRESLLYTATHINHPSAVWVRQSSQNYLWLYQLFCSVCKEYTYRYGRQHASERLSIELKYLPNKIPVREFTEPTPAMPEEYITKGDSITSYRTYYKNDKKRLFSWKGRVNDLQNADSIYYWLT